MQTFLPDRVRFQKSEFKFFKETVLSSEEKHSAVFTDCTLTTLSAPTIPLSITIHYIFFF